MTHLKKITLFDAVYLIFALLFIINGISSVLRHTEINELFIYKRLIHSIYPPSIKNSLTIKKDNFYLPREVKIGFDFPFVHRDTFLHSLYPISLYYGKTDELFKYSWILTYKERLDFYMSNGYQVIHIDKIKDAPDYYFLNKRN